MTEDDRKALEKCHQCYLNKEYHPEALHLFAKNAEVDEHNDKMLDRICTDIRTCYELDRNGKEIGVNKNHHKGKCSKVLRLARNARVMITKNISVNDGLANGVMGRIVDFVETENKKVSRVIIKCDLPTVGRLHRVTCSYCHGKDTVCVTRENDSIDQQNNDFGTRKNIKQFPLRLSWAVTIHKAQGITVDQVVMSTKDLFGTGMGYTGLSRVHVDEGLFLIDLHLDKIYCNERIDTILSQMKKMTIKASVFQQSPPHINILCHNIESLQSNFNALRNYHLTQKADVICLTETWLNDKNIDLEKIMIKDYNVVYKNRDSSFALNHLIHSQKGGGVAIYFRENLSVKKIDSSKQLNLEYITIEIEQYNTTIITCYRSPQQHKKEFLNNLLEHLREINLEKKILLVGDFNEDTLDNKRKFIESNLEHLGFVNLFKGLSTTNSLTSLDCIYCNFISNKEENRAVVGTYFSFHDALVLSCNTQNEEVDLIEKNNFESEDKMDTNNSPQMSSLTINNPSEMNKRKRTPRENTCDKISKKINLTSRETTSEDKRKEKQLHFLYNLNEKEVEETLEYFEDTFTMKDQLAAIGLKKIDVLADGNCFFRSLSRQLYGHENEHLNFRATAIHHLICNNNNFEPFINRNIDPTIEDYIDRMSKNGTFADYLVISSAAIIINKNIIIHEIGKKPLLVPGSDYIEDQLHVVYHPDKLHYESVIGLDGTSAFLSSELILFT